MRILREPGTCPVAHRKRKLPVALLACVMGLAQVQSAPADIVNSVVVTGTYGTVTVQKTAAATVGVEASNPSISLFKTGAYNDGGDGKPDVGDTISYRFTVSNTGNVSLRNVTVSDPLVSVAGGPLTVLQPGRTDATTFTALYQLTQADIDAGQVSNTASVSGLDPGGASVSAIDGATTALAASQGLTLAKAGTLNDGGDGRADAGDTIFYQFLVTNTGPTALRNVRITDPLLDLANRAPVGRALAALDGLLTGSDPMLTASAGDGLRGAIVEEWQAVKPEIAALSDGPPAANTDLPPLPMNLNGTRRLVQLTGDARHPKDGDQIGIVYSLTNTGDAPLFAIGVRDASSTVFNGMLEQLMPGATDTGGVLFTRKLTEEEIKDGAIRADALISARGRNLELNVALTGPLPLSGLESADDLMTAAITPAAITNLAPGAQALFSATYTLTQADIDSGFVGNTAAATGVDPGGATLVSVDTVLVPLASRPAIALVKSGSADLGSNSIADPGDIIAYGFTVTNTGNVTLTNLTISDSLVTVMGGPISSLAPGASNTTAFTASYAITQADINAGRVVNQAIASGTAPTGTVVTDPSSATSVSGNDPTVTSLLPTTAIAVVKTMTLTADLNGNGLTDAGDQLNYVFAVTNTGNVTLANVTVTDPLATVTGGPIAVLAPGQTDSTVFRATYIITQADADAGRITNQATASAVTPDGKTVTDLSDGTAVTGNSPTVTVIPELAGIALVKSAASVTDSNGNGINDVGDVINYAFAVTNTGNVTLRSISVSDPLVRVSGGPLARLAPAQTDATTFTARHVITAADALAGRVTNQATASGVTPSGRGVSDLSDNANVEENDPTITPVTVLPAIALVKRVEAITDRNGNGQTDAGDTIEYGFTVANTGNVALSNVTVTDPLVTVSGGPILNLEAGETDSTTFTATYRITAADVTAGRVTNQATALGTSPSGRAVSDLSDGENVSENDPTVTILSSAPAIALVKSVTGVTDRNGNGLTDAGDEIAYAFVVTNTGNVALANVTVTDPKVPVQGGPIASLGVSQTDGTTFMALYVIAQADADQGMVSNQATVSGTARGDVSVTDVSDEASLDGSDPTVTAINQTPGIGLIKTVAAVSDVNGNGRTDSGDIIIYAFAVTNTGNQTLDNLRITDALVPVTGGPLARLAVGATDSTTFTARYAVTIADAVAGRVSNQANVSATTPPGGTITDLSDNDSLSGSDPTVTPVALSVPQLSKTAVDSEIRRGEPVAFVIVSSDAGPGPLSITDIMPPGFTFVTGSATANGGPVTATADGRRLRFDGLSPNAAGAILLKLSLRASTSSQTGRVINRAELRDAAGNLLASAQAAVTIMDEHVFDCGEVIGRVFDDTNRNGYAEDGEPGLAGVRVATVKGLLVTTDKHGRFHVPCADIPDAATGSNFMMKLDTRTLPSGYSVTSENPRDVRLTRGKVTKLNFGASILRQVMLDLSDAAFVNGKPALRPQWHAGIAHLIRVLEQEPSVLKLTYEHGGVGPALAERRLATVRMLIANEWKRRHGVYSLAIDARAVGVE